LHPLLIGDFVLVKLRLPARALGLKLNEHIKADGPTVFAHAMEAEGLALSQRAIAGLA
jgi:hypothetical protein